MALLSTSCKNVACTRGVQMRLYEKKNPVYNKVLTSQRKTSQIFHQNVYHTHKNQNREFGF